MSTPAPTAFGPSTPITIKVSHDGSNKKLKLAFSDLTAESFEPKLRMALNISPFTECQFERYSDSAAKFVTLNRCNTSVYKQLARAAKAKQKLKLRVVYPDLSAAEDQQVSNVATTASSPAPLPVSIEDVPESDEPQFTAAKAAGNREPAEANDNLFTQAFANAVATAIDVAKERASNVLDQSDPSKVTSQNSTAQPSEVYYDQSIKTENKSSSATCNRITDVQYVSHVASGAARPAFTVCCNRCHDQIPDAHFHCSTCENGDYDLCLKCVGNGETCLNTTHWLIRRSVQNGLIVNSTTERIAPKAKPAAKADPAIKAQPAAKAAPAIKAEPAPKAEPACGPEMLFPNYFTSNAFRTTLPVRSLVDDSNSGCPAAKPQFTVALSKFVKSRTCNNCIRDSVDADFVHCDTCFDFDLCQTCFAANDHGHHPGHPFSPAQEGTAFGWDVTRRLPAGRGARHNAICDDCNSFITGVRYKCMQCPDWDLCSECIGSADSTHGGHCFMELYEPLQDSPLSAKAKIKAFVSPQAVHTGIHCDGPQCTGANKTSSYIVGDRYKCAVCHNKDYCAVCEAHPANKHNKTHPLIKFRTPVRHVSVTTTGEHGNGSVMPVMGDRRVPPSRTASQAGSQAGKASVADLNLNKVQTVLDVKPTAHTLPDLNAKAASKPSKATLVEPAEADLGAMFQRETIPDGTTFAPNFVFEQTWVLRNTGSVAWPAGSRVQFVSGDYMGHVDPTNPAGIRELVSASESTVCYEPLAPGSEYAFTVLLRTPPRAGKVISYWRLTTKGGIKFGDRLWCDVNVQAKEEPAPVVEVREGRVVKAGGAWTEEKPVETSQMIFPKLEKESPVASMHEASEAAAKSDKSEEISQADELEWADDSDSGFMTDEEYDILDASDEEFMSSPRK